MNALSSLFRDIWQNIYNNVKIRLKNTQRKQATMNGSEQSEIFQIFKGGMSD